MKTAKHTKNTTFSKTHAGNFQVTTEKNEKEITYCFGDCKEWAKRFYYSIVHKEMTVDENDFAKIVYCEAWGYSVESKVITHKSSIPFRYSVKGYEGCKRWFDELARANENPVEIDNRLPDSWNVLLNA